MSAAKHTPGPWARSPYSSIVGIAIHGAGLVIAGVRADRPTAEANAALIAAAPDLLALAHQYADECAECGGTAMVWTHPADPQDSVSSDCPACADIWAVINRAEGQS